MGEGGGGHGFVPAARVAEAEAHRGLRNFALLIRHETHFERQRDRKRFPVRQVFRPVDPAENGVAVALRVVQREFEAVAARAARNDVAAVEAGEVELEAGLLADFRAGGVDVPDRRHESGTGGRGHARISGYARGDDFSAAVFAPDLEERQRRLPLGDLAIRIVGAVGSPPAVQDVPVVRKLNLVLRLLPEAHEVRVHKPGQIGEADRERIVAGAADVVFGDRKRQLLSGEFFRASTRRSAVSASCPPMPGP